jgi:catechol 2,3-dioxygenase-like lactoylglutathione lyase family enzyme
MLTALSINSCKKFREPFVVPEKSFEIRQLVLLGRNPDENFHFWTEELGLDFEQNSSGSFRVQLGTSRLVFNPSPTFIVPRYHFAINIPSNQIENALEWLINKDGKFPDGPKNPVKIWTNSESGAQITRRDLFNAHSIYFSDPAGNVIELVARHDLNNAQPGPFTKSMFLNISEVSIVTRDIRKAAPLLESIFGVSEIEGSTNSYKPIGGLNGFFVLIVPGRPLGPNPDVQAFPYQMEITVKHTEILEDLLIPQSAVVIKTEL